MKTIGIIGGMSWESTVEYYRIINQQVNKALGGLHSAKILMESYDFEEIRVLQKTGNWDELSNILISSAKKLVANGADVIVIATNTMHKLAPEIEAAIGNVPVFHIADATAKEIQENNYDKVALLGTKFTMQEDFYKDKFINEYGIKVVIPELDEQEFVHNIIFDELCKGIICTKSEKILNDIIDNCKCKGAQAVVLGCTELPNIIKNASIPILDTTEIHSVGVVDFAIKKCRVYA